MAVSHHTVLTSSLQWSRKVTRPVIFKSDGNVWLSSDKKIYRRRLVLDNGAGVRSSLDYDNGSQANNGYYEYEQGLRGMSQEYPRPTKIPWRKEISNSVQLIGVVASPVQSKQLSSGKVLAWSRLAVYKSPTDTSWVNLNFWEELAHVAIQHVEKGDQIYVSGRLVSDTVENNDGTQETYYKVVVRELHFVERNYSTGASNAWDANSNSITPGQQKNNAPYTTETIERLWQAFFANPGDWWDNRKGKRNPNYPDFKHKDTGEALWVNGRYNPSWVISQLSVLDSRMESLREETADTPSDLLGDNLTSY